MKKLWSFPLLFCFCFSLFLSAPVSARDAGSAAISSVERIRQIAAELSQISQERENCLKELENINEERKQELQERLDELRQRENELKELKLQLELFGNLIDDQAVYYKSLQKKLAFWRIISGVLATSLLTALIIQGASN